MGVTELASERAERPAVLEAPIIEVEWWPDLTLAVGLVLAAIALARWQRLGLTRDFSIGAIRAFAQLVLVGYVLVFIFAIERWYLVIAALLVMLGIAAKTAVDRLPRAGPGLLPITSMALLVGAGLTLVYVAAFVVRVDPWYNPRYLIPLFGMIVANAMNAAALAAERLEGEVRSRRAEIEAYLALGADLERATRDPVRNALTAALIPTINGLMVVGIVALPGMMTGQILAGTSPLLAVRYQIVVMFMLASSVAITAVAVALWYRRSFFTPALQLKPE